MKEKTKTKRLLPYFFCAMIALSCTFSPLLTASCENAGIPLTVGVPVDRCPVFYRDAKTNEIVGIGVDLMRSAAEAAGFCVTFRMIEEDTLKDALDNPAYDAILPFGSAISSVSGQTAIVSDNLIETPFTLVTKDRREMPSLNDLRVGMLRSLTGAAETVQQLFPGIEITMYATMTDCVSALRGGHVDALLHNSYVWSYVLQKPSYADLVVQPSAMFSMDFRAGALDTPAGRAIIDQLNSGIAELTNTRRQAIVLDHTSRRLYRYDFSDYLYQYGLILLLALLLFVSLAVIAVQRVHTVRKEQEEKMRYLIDHDPLTGAYSLNGFRKRVEELLHAYPEIPYLLAFTNIRNFKFINDSLGMKAGDDLLRFLTQRTMETLSDKEAIGRITGDRFAVLRRCEGDESIIHDDQYVIDSVRSYFLDRGRENRVQVCCGVYVLTPEDYRMIDVDHMLDFARMAEKRVRVTRKDGCDFYNPEQWEKGKQAAEVITRLPAAIQSGELQVWYQPQVNYEKKKLIDAEALCRWEHGKLGWISPSEFIPILEEAGLIYDLDSFVWEKVCQDLHRWNEQGNHRSVSVNLSRCSIQEDRNIPEHFHRLIQTYDLTPDQLRIEITETAFAEKPDLLINTTEKLRALGFHVEMDDFGSGYSSLHMLKDVPVDRIKLDLHFLTESGNRERGRIIVTNMIQMVRALGMDLIVEGVETVKQAHFLQGMGCAEMQGFYFYRPMSVQDYEKLCNETDSIPPEL